MSPSTIPNALFFGKKAALFCFLHNKLLIVSHLFAKKRKKIALSDAPKILLCCSSSLGDVLLASSVIEPILSKWPKAILGFLYAKQAHAILDKHDKITHRHQVDPWLNPKKGKLRNLLSFFFCSLFIYPKTIKQIKAIDYDICIELNPFFPNSLPLAFNASIPTRIAFIPSGYAVCITDKVPFPCPKRYLLFIYPFLLKVLGIEEKTPKISLPFLPKKTHGRIVLHIGTSDVKKEWPLTKWSELAKLLRTAGYPLFFTGQGKKEDAQIAQIAEENLGENLSSSLDFYEFANIIEGASAVISVDSVSVHLAASFEVPFIGLYLYNRTLNLWLPEIDNCRLLIDKSCVFDTTSPLPKQAHFLQEGSAHEIFSHFLLLQGNKL